MLIAGAPAGCSQKAHQQPVSNPAPKARTHSTPFVQRSPKYLDPASSYSGSETPHNIYETLYGYHLKRPYELVPRRDPSTRRYLDAQGQPLPADAPGEAPSPKHLRHQDPAWRALPAAPALPAKPTAATTTTACRRQLKPVLHSRLSAHRHARADGGRLRLRLSPPGQPAHGVAHLFRDGRPRGGRMCRDTATACVNATRPYLFRAVRPVAGPARRRRLYRRPGAGPAHAAHPRQRQVSAVQILAGHDVHGAHPEPTLHNQPGMAERPVARHLAVGTVAPTLMAESLQNRRHVLVNSLCYHGEAYPCEGPAQEAGLLADCGKPRLHRSRGIQPGKEAIQRWKVAGLLRRAAD